MKRGKIPDPENILATVDDDVNKELNEQTMEIELQKLKDLKGLNLVPFIITAHYNKEKYRDSVEYGAKKIKLPVVALYDTQAVVVENGKYRIVGKGPKEFFNGFKEKI